MTDLQRQVLEYYYPDYEDLFYRIEHLSDEELQYVVDNLPSDPDELERAICGEIEADIIATIINFFVKEDGFLDDNEDCVYDSISGELVEPYGSSYCVDIKLAEQYVKDWVENCDNPENWHLVENPNYYELLSWLNDEYPFKFVSTNYKRL